MRQPYPDWGKRVIPPVTDDPCSRPVQSSAAQAESVLRLADLEKWLALDTQFTARRSTVCISCLSPRGTGRSRYAKAVPNNRELEVPRCAFSAGICECIRASRMPSAQAVPMSFLFRCAFLEETIAVAGRMSRKIIIYRMRTPERMGDQMIGLPFVLDQTTANVTSATCLGEDLFSFATG